MTLTTPSVTTMHLLCCRGMRLLLNAPALRSLLIVDCSFNLFTPTHCSRLESLSLVVRILQRPQHCIFVCSSSVRGHLVSQSLPSCRSQRRGLFDDSGMLRTARLSTDAWQVALYTQGL